MGLDPYVRVSGHASIPGGINPSPYNLPIYLMPPLAQMYPLSCSNPRKNSKKNTFNILQMFGL